MKRHYVIGGVIVAAAGLAIWLYSARVGGGSAPAADETSSPSVLVQTQAVRQQQLPVLMQAFGEVDAGLPQALSFPQAGQLVQLSLVLGQRVHRGDVLAVIASDPVAVSTYAQAASAVEFARRELQRNQQLLGLKLATEAQVDAARKQRSDAEATLAAQARLGGARASAQLTAPFDGVVTGLPVALGDRVAPGATVVQLGRTGRLRALLAIEPSKSVRVKPGMPVAITPVLDGAATIQATISQIQDIVDPKTLMVTAIGWLPASGDARIVPGARVEAAIQLGQRQAWAVPRQAVLNDDKGDYLFQVVRQHAHRVDVNKVAERGEIYGVEGKIDPNAPVVVLGNYELTDGAQVREGAR